MVSVKVQEDGHEIKSRFLFTSPESLPLALWRATKRLHAPITMHIVKHRVLAVERKLKATWLTSFVEGKSIKPRVGQVGR